MSNLLTFLFLLYILSPRILNRDTVLLNLGMKNSVVLIFQTSLYLLWIVLDTIETCWLYVKAIFSQLRFLIGWWLNYIFPANLLYMATLFGSFYLVLVNLLLVMCANAQVKTTVFCMSLWFAYVVLRNQTSKIREFAAILDQDLYCKYNAILVLPLTLFCFTQQCFVFASVDLLDVAHCSKKTPVMNEVILQLSKKTTQGDIEAIVVAHNRAEKLNEELNDFNTLRDHPGDMTKMSYKKLWGDLCKRNAFAESHTFSNDPRSFISQEHHSLKILMQHGSEGLDRANIVGPFHIKQKIPGDVVHTQQKLIDYQQLGGKISIVGIDELKKTRADIMLNLISTVKLNETTIKLPVEIPYKLHITLQKPVELSDSIMKSLPEGSLLNREQAMVQQMTSEFAKVGIKHPVEVDCQQNTNSWEMENVTEIFRKRQMEANAMGGANKPLATPLAKAWIGTDHRHGQYEDRGGVFVHNGVTIVKPKLPVGGCTGLKVSLGHGLTEMFKNCIKCTIK